MKLKHQTCNRCGSDRVLLIAGKCSDCCDARYKGADYQGYVPRIDGIGGGDYIDVEICVECGQVQGTFPVPETQLEEVFSLQSDGD